MNGLNDKDVCLPVEPVVGVTGVGVGVVTAEVITRLSVLKT